MDERSSRIFVGLCLLVLVWIGVYWMWEPERDDRPRITFAEQPVEIEPEPIEIDQSLNRSDPIVDQNPIAIESDPQPVFIPPRVIHDLNDRHEPTQIIPPTFEQYTVGDGETMGSIARKVYGSSDRWDVISRANPRVDPKKLKVGQVLRLPVDPDNIQGKPVTGDPTNGSDPARTNKVVEYSVQSGDSLSLIAQKFYGSSKYARMIFEYNWETLSSMDDISVGQILKLPPLEEPEGSDG